MKENVELPDNNWDDDNDLVNYEDEDNNDEVGNVIGTGDMKLELPDCPLTDILISSIVVSKPFGITWSDEKMINFLQKRGYKIIKRHSDNRDADYNVAIKPDSDFIPEDDFGNIRECFNSEVEEILLKWLLKIGE